MKKRVVTRAVRWIFCIVTVFFAIPLIYTGCSAPDQPPIRIGVNAWPPCELWYIAADQGFFGDTRVELIRFSSWRDNMLSLYKGQTDITHASYFNALYYSEKGEKAKIILRTEIIEGGEGFVVKDTIENKEQLKGKRIAVETGTDEHFLLHKALDLFGLAPGDVTLISVPSVEASKKFIGNEVEACFTYEPFMSEAAGKGDGKIISTTSDYPGYMIDVLVGRSAAMEKRQKDFVAIVKAWYKARDFVRDHPDKAFPLMAANEKMTPADFKTFYNYFTFYSIDDNKAYLKSKPFYDKLEEINTFLLSKGFLKEKVDLSGLVDSSIVDTLKSPGN